MPTVYLTDPIVPDRGDRTKWTDLFSGQPALEVLNGTRDATQADLDEVRRRGAAVPRYADLERQMAESIAARAQATAIVAPAAAAAAAPAAALAAASAAAPAAAPAAASAAALAMTGVPPAMPGTVDPATVAALVAALTGATAAAPAAPAVGTTAVMSKSDQMMALQAWSVGDIKTVTLLAKGVRASIKVRVAHKTGKTAVIVPVDAVDLDERFTLPLPDVTGHAYYALDLDSNLDALDRAIARQAQVPPRPDPFSADSVLQAATQPQWHRVLVDRLHEEFHIRVCVGYAGTPQPKEVRLSATAAESEVACLTTILQRVLTQVQQDATYTTLMRDVVGDALWRLAELRLLRKAGKGNKSDLLAEFRGVLSKRPLTDAVAEMEKKMRQRTSRPSPLPSGRVRHQKELNALHGAWRLMQRGRFARLPPLAHHRARAGDGQGPSPALRRRTVGRRLVRSDEGTSDDQRSGARAPHHVTPSGEGRENRGRRVKRPCGAARPSDKTGGNVSDTIPAATTLVQCQASCGPDCPKLTCGLPNIEIVGGHHAEPDTTRGSDWSRRQRRRRLAGLRQRHGGHAVPAGGRQSGEHSGRTSAAGFPPVPRPPQHTPEAASGLAGGTEARDGACGRESRERPLRGDLGPEEQRLEQPPGLPRSEHNHGPPVCGRADRPADDQPALVEDRPPGRPQPNTSHHLPQEARAPVPPAVQDALGAAAGVSTCPGTTDREPRQGRAAHHEGRARKGSHLPGPAGFSASPDVDDVVVGGPRQRLPSPHGGSSHGDGPGRLPTTRPASSKLALASFLQHVGDDDYEPGYIIEVREPGSGDQCQVVRYAARGAEGHRRKLNPSDRTKSGSLILAPTSTNIINIQAVVAENEHMKDVFALCQDEETFLALFEDAKVEGLTKAKRALSRDMAVHISDLRKHDIMEDLPAQASEGRTIERIYMGLFLVPKKKPPHGRLIGDARPLNELQRKPSDMGLPRILQVITQVLGADLAAKTDGVSYFYQIPLGRKIRRFFKARLAGRRGVIHEMQFVRLPMGWKFSPFIAQQLSNCVVRGGIGTAWLDDFIVLGRNEQDFARNRTTFLERTTRYNIEVDNTELNPSTTLEALGLQFDLAEKRYRLDPAWVAKRTAAWDKHASVVSAGQDMTFREVFELYGALIWAQHVRHIPLWNHPEAMEALASLATQVEGNYDKPTTLPNYAVRDLLAWIEDTKNNTWRPSPSPATIEAHMFSDASNTGGAWARVLHDFIVDGDSWVRNDTEHIFLAELDALCAGAMSLSPDDQVRHQYNTDNSALNFAMKKGLSSSYVANVRLRDTFGQNWPTSKWISTLVMPADSWSRGEKMPPLPAAIDESFRAGLRAATDRTA